MAGGIGQGAQHAAGVAGRIAAGYHAEQHLAHLAAGQQQPVGQAELFSSFHPLQVGVVKLLAVVGVDQLQIGGEVGWAAAGDPFHLGGPAHGAGMELVVPAGGAVDGFGFLEEQQLLLQQGLGGLIATGVLQQRHHHRSAVVAHGDQVHPRVNHRAVAASMAGGEAASAFLEQLAQPLGHPHGVVVVVGLQLGRPHGQQLLSAVAQVAQGRGIAVEELAGVRVHQQQVDPAQVGDLTNPVDLFG